MESLGGVSGPLALVIVIVRETYNFLNHKKIRFRCCSRNMNISLDVDSTSRQSIDTDNRTGRAKVYPYNSHETRHIPEEV